MLLSRHWSTPVRETQIFALRKLISSNGNRERLEATGKTNKVINVYCFKAAWESQADIRDRMLGEVVKVKKCRLLGRVWLCATPWTIACQAPLSMGFSKQEYWSGLPCPFSGTEPGSPASQADSLPSETLKESATYENSMEKPILHLDAQQWFSFFNEHQSHRELVKKKQIPRLILCMWRGRRVIFTSTSC